MAAKTYPATRWTHNSAAPPFPAAPPIRASIAKTAIKANVRATYAKTIDVNTMTNLSQKPYEDYPEQPAPTGRR